MSRAEALRAAQVSLLREGQATLRDAPATTAGRLPPFYWAAFVLSGRWEDATPPP